MDYSEFISDIEEVDEEISKKYGEKWNQIKEKKFGDLSRQELIDFLNITMEGMEKIRARKKETELKEESKNRCSKI